MEAATKQELEYAVQRLNEQIASLEAMLHRLHVRIDKLERA